MAKVTNLARARKTRARDDKRVKSAANAARFGQNTSEKSGAARTAEKLSRHLDQHKRDEQE